MDFKVIPDCVGLGLGLVIGGGGGGGFDHFFSPCIIILNLTSTHTKKLNPLSALSITVSILVLDDCT